MEKFKIKDESGDKKYFTQIPNMVVNHSTAYEQSLYLIMKRMAGEHGSCFASLNFLSKKMGIHKTTVSKTIKKLLKRKWISEIEHKKVKGGIVRQFVIVDLWRLNIDLYESGAEMTTNESGAVVIGSGAVVDGSGAQSDTKKNYKEEEKKNTEQSSEHSSLSFLRKIPKEIVDEMVLKFKVEPEQVKLKAETLADYCDSKGRKYKDYMAFLRNALRKDFGERPTPKKKQKYEIIDGMAQMVGYE